MKHDCVQVLGASLKRIFTAHSSYIGSADCNWEDIAAQVILQCDGKVAIMSQEVYDLLCADERLSEPFSEERPIPYVLSPAYIALFGGLKSNV